MMNLNRKSYNELMKLQTYDERVKYLMTHSAIGDETFGCDRYLVRQFYNSAEWRNARRQTIIRDKGNDMGLDDYSIGGHITVHHINPITPEDIKNGSSVLFDLNNLISVSDSTHKLIHYGYEVPKNLTTLERKPGDTCPWRR